METDEIEKFVQCSAWLTRMSELSRFVFIKGHVTLHVKSNAKKVNCAVICLHSELAEN